MKNSMRNIKNLNRAAKRKESELETCQGGFRRPGETVTEAWQKDKNVVSPDSERLSRLMDVQC